MGIASVKASVAKVLAGFQETEEGARTVIDGEEAFRVRVVGRVVEKFVNSERSYGNVVLDDETDTIRAKFFSSNIGLVEGAELGDLVEVMGRVRKFRDEVHLTVDEMATFTDVNWELLRKLQLVMPDNRRERRVLEAVKAGEDTLEGLKERLGEDVTDTLRTLLEKGEVYEASPGKYKAV